MAYNAHAYQQEIEKLIGGFRRRDSADEVAYDCPFCHATDLHVNYRKGTSICHKCTEGAHRSLKSLLKAIGGNPLLVREQEPDDLLEFVDETLYKKSEAKYVDAILPEGYIAFHEQMDEDGWIVSDYLTSRGVDWATQLELEAGYGTIRPTYGYAILPVYVKGKLVMWTSRRVDSISEEGPKVRHGYGSGSKNALFQYDRAKSIKPKRVFINEGPFDSISLHQRLDSRDTAVAIFGTTLSAGQIALLSEMGAEEYLLLLDGDAAGIKGTKKAVKDMVAAGLPTSIVNLPDARDPDELDDETLNTAICAATRCSEYDLLLS